MWIEIIGYMGMGFILISFLMKKIHIIRIVNMIGAVLSLTYGILTFTIPTAVLNGALLIVNGIYLFIFLHKTRRKKDIQYPKEEK